MGQNQETLPLSNEEFHARKQEIIERIQEHKLEAQRFQQQTKMFLRQGIDELPEKHQQQLEAIEAQEKELQEALAILEKQKPIQ